MRLPATLLTVFFAQQVAASPNILLVLADDIGVDVSPCYADSLNAHMPTLQGLCADGMVFENAYAAPVCSPTRAMILTGQESSRNGVGGVLNRDNNVSLSIEGDTLFEAFQGSGYATALIGKWHLSHDQRNFDHPEELGVPYHFGPFSGGVRNYENWTAIENGDVVRVTKYATTELADRAIDWIADQPDPWFLWLAFNAPHSPFHLPPGDLHNQDHLTGSESDIRANTDEYYTAALEALDHELGRILSTLDEETVVIFMGDNGTPTQVLGRAARGRAKGSLYEGGIHVPLVVSGPNIEIGRADALVGATDLYGTISDLAGLGATAPDSHSLEPILAGGEGSRSHVLVEHFSNAEARGRNGYGWAIRSDRYKLIQFDDGDAQLYDLKNDPLERRNLLRAPSSEHRKTANELRATYDQLTQ